MHFLKFSCTQEKEGIKKKFLECISTVKVYHLKLHHSDFSAIHNSPHTHQMWKVSSINEIHMLASLIR